MMDKQREAFEAWMRSTVAKNAKPGDFDGMGEFWFDRIDGGAYEVMRIQDAWAAWQAATLVERERCANAVDQWMRREDMTGDDIRAG
jgi:hypothetical protein